MKIVATSNPARARRRSEQGLAVLIVIVLLAIMAALAMNNNLVLGRLQKELRLVEHRQAQRANRSPATNEHGAKRATFIPRPNPPRTPAAATQP